MITCTVSPEVTGPDLVTWLATSTAMYDGSAPAGGGVLLPGSVVHEVPQPGAGGVSSKPLKLAGAEPPLSVFTPDHCAPQNVTAPVALRSPTTNDPPGL